MSEEGSMSWRAQASTTVLLNQCLFALFSVQNLFNSVRDPNQLAKGKKKYGVIEGDHITLINIFNLYNLKKSDSEKKGFCKELNINEKSLQKAIKIKAQLKTQLISLGVKIRKSDDYDDPEAILKSLITGYFSNVAQRQTDGTYRNIRSQLDEQLVIHPSSVLANIKPKWILYHEIIVTSKKYMREVSAIQVEWLLELAPHFYVDRRKQQLEEKHKKESIRNIDHDFKHTNKEGESSISSMIQKSNSRFAKKGMNFNQLEPSPPLAIKDEGKAKAIDSEETIEQPYEPVVYKRFKKSQDAQPIVSKDTMKSQPNIGLSFDDDY